MTPLPCPFCGRSDIEVIEGSTFRWRVAQCGICGAQAGEVRMDTLNKDREKAKADAIKLAIKEWNTRIEE